MTKALLLPGIQEDEMCPAENSPTTAGLWCMLNSAGTQATDVTPFPEKGHCQRGVTRWHHKQSIGKVMRKYRVTWERGCSWGVLSVRFLISKRKIAYVTCEKLCTEDVTMWETLHWRGQSSMFPDVTGSPETTHSFLRSSIFFCLVALSSYQTPGTDVAWEWQSLSSR